MATLGGQENAFTSYDYTAYFQRVTHDHLEHVMAFEADRMTGLVLNDPVVLPERDVVLEERRMRTDNDPGAQLGEAMQAALFVNHPYGRPVIGWEQEIGKLNREEALAFYRRFYAPNNAIVVIAGDVTPEEVRALAEKTYGAVPKNDAIRSRSRPREPEPRAEPPGRACRSARRPAVALRAITSCRPIGRRRRARRKRSMCSRMCSARGTLSRLYRTLVIERHDRRQRRRLVWRHVLRRDAVRHFGDAASRRVAGRARNPRSTP